jgi:cytochrome c oxidase subunit 2
MSYLGKFTKSYPALALLLLSVVILASFTPEDPQSTFDTVGPVARSQLVLFYWIFWAAVLVWVAMTGVILYIVIRFRRRPGDVDPEQTHGNTRLEIGWTVMPAIVLAVVAVPTVSAIFYNANSPDPDALTIEVVASQWWWEFKYPHPTEAGEKLVTANEMHMPEGEVVNIRLESRDVLHSFWIPKIAGKVDMVPNSVNTMWIQADEAGEFHGQCAEFCGEAHARMRFRVVVEPRLEFDEWLAAQAEPAAVPAPESLAEQGQALFEGNQAQCWACHTVLGSSKSKGKVGPNLTHLASRGHIAAGTLENTAENLRKWMRDNCEVKRGNIMCRDAKVYNDPERRLSDQDISALVAYLESLD